MKTRFTSKPLRELHARKAQLRNSAQGILDEAERAGRALTADERASFDDITAKMRDVDDGIAAEIAALEEEVRAPALGGPSQPGGWSGGRRFADLFPSEPLSSDGFESFSHFMRAIHDGLADGRLRAAISGGSESVGADGGFLVPSEYAAELLDASLENEIVRPRAVVRPMTTNSLFVAGFDTSDHSGAIGGFTGKWLSEGDSMPIQKGLIKAHTLMANKLGILTAATNELLSDSPYFETELRGILVKAIGWYLDLAYLTGDGVGKPLGVLSDGALISVPKETSQAADTIVWENIKKMYARLHPASLKNAVWVANTTTKVQLLSLVQPVKNVAGTENVGGTWIPVLRDDGKGGFTMLGIPVEFTEKTPRLGDKGDLILADFSQYVIGLRKEMTLDKSGHVGFDKDETYYRAIVRSTGEGRWSKAVTPKNGDTLSWCVTLAERA